MRARLRPHYDPFENPQGTVWRLVAADQVPEGAETAPLQAEEGTAPTAADEATPDAATSTASPVTAEGEAVAVEEG